MNGVAAATPAPPWELLSATAKGVGKRYSQDRCTAHAAADGRAVVLAVADGHGSAAHFRSDLGARWAVEEFAACAGDFAGDAALAGGDAARWPRLLANARSLPQRVVHRWRNRVRLHECNSPAHGGPSPAGEEFTAYGSTLIGAVATDWLLVCWQLGDGDVVLIGDAGVPCTPLSTGPDMGDETESLCEPEAWRRMRLHWRPLVGGDRRPGLLLSTDGLSKSFADHQGFLDFATGIRERAAERGVPDVQSNLADWLAQAAAYSGDDTTLVGAFARPTTQERRTAS